MKKTFLMIMVASGLLTQGYASYNNGCMLDCCDSFDGLYIGGTVGWGFYDRTWVNRDSWTDLFINDFQVSQYSSTNDGVALGVQLGYNLECECAVVGLEFDANWADFQRNHVLTPAEEVPEDVLTFRDDTRWFGSIRARVGGVIGNNLLMFATAGAAWADIHHSWTMNDSVTGIEETFSVHRGRWGLAVGAGAEWIFCGNFGFKAEVLYHKFPEHSSSFSSVTPVGRDVHFGLLSDIWVARIGVNYRLRSLFSCFC